MVNTLLITQAIRGPVNLSHNLHCTLAWCVRHMRHQDIIKYLSMPDSYQNVSKGALSGVLGESVGEVDNTLFLLPRMLLQGLLSAKKIYIKKLQSCTINYFADLAPPIIYRKDSRRIDSSLSSSKKKIFLSFGHAPSNTIRLTNCVIQFNRIRKKLERSHYTTHQTNSFSIS